MCVAQGIPQVSILGPLLYISYVNDCFDIIKTYSENSTILMYADDTVLISSGEDYNQAMDENQSLFERYIDWSNENGLKINVSKTKHMLLSSKSRSVEVKANILSLEYFVKDNIQRVNFKLYLFGKIHCLLTFKAAVMVYKQMVLPFFDYLDILIDGCAKKFVDKLQTLQFRGIKIIYQ